MSMALHACFESTLLGFKDGPGNATLSNDRLQGADSYFWMVGNGHRHRAEIRSPLHNDMAAPLPDSLKPMLFEDAADISSGEDAEFTHEPLRSASRRPGYGGGAGFRRGRHIRERVPRLL